MYRYIGWDYPLNKTASLVDAQPLGLAARKILCCAEQLIAEHGLEGVSTRMISRASGQKNNSALQYHFKNREGLIEAILDYRVTPVNQQRLLRLQHLRLAVGQAPAKSCMCDIMVSGRGLSRIC